MLFNSFTFVAFFAAFLPAYLLVRRHVPARNGLLLLASYVFYGYWDVRFLSLLWLSTGVDYVVALQIHASADPLRRKRLLWISLATNLGVLGFFKYYDFFEQNLIALIHALGGSASSLGLSVILPVGISFYTFQSLGYTLDVYRGRVEPMRKLLDFAAFVAFFPQLMAGPIERAPNMAPQFLSVRRIELPQVHAGLHLMLVGFFKKLVIADNAAVIANEVFGKYEQYQGVDLWIGALAFTLQIYGDFSGYSDIARGLAKLLGFDLMVNFRLPYFAQSPADFWSRWHISLSTWLRDYLYIPLGGNRGSKLLTYRNLLITMLLGGLWHGAAWNFLLWGGYHGLLLIAYRAWDRGGDGAPRTMAVRGARVALMFLFTVIGWILFRAPSFDAIGHFATSLDFTTSDLSAAFGTRLALLAAPLLALELFEHSKKDLLAIAKLWLPARVLVYTALLSVLVLYAAREQTEFIYFQF